MVSEAEAFSKSLIMASFDSLYIILDITYGLFRRQLKGHPFREAWTLWGSVSLISGALEEHLVPWRGLIIVDICPYVLALFYNRSGSIYCIFQSLATNHLHKFLLHLSFVSTQPENAIISLWCYYSFAIFLLLRLGQVFQSNGEHCVY